MLCPLKDTEFYGKQGGEDCKKPVIYEGTEKVLVKKCLIKH